MKYVLIILLLLVCGAAYYDRMTLQKAAADDKATTQKQIDDLTAQVTKLQADNKKLTDDSAAAAKELTETKTNLASVTAQAQAAQKQIDDAKKQAQAAATKAAAPPPPPKSPNDLGTIATLDGKTYQKCQLLKAEADGITISHSAGITKLFYGLLPPDMQKQFGYDPHVTTGLTPEQVVALENQRKAAVVKFGN